MNPAPKKAPPIIVSVQDGLKALWAQDDGYVITLHTELSRTYPSERIGGDLIQLE